ncbi:MAG: CPBP family intramembrane metalloprotease [Ignavibacteriales bacterium]|nr:CPBP family intramembrane metalloprotease [Ignavibacteriales bacterium]
MKDKLLAEIRKVKELDKKIVILFISIAILQTISWYYTSRKYFRFNLYQYFSDNPKVDLIEYAYWFLGDTISFFILPILIILFIFKEKIADYGLKFGEIGFGFKLSAIIILIMFIVVWFVSSTKSFYITYPYLSEARESWTVFLIFEFLLFIYIFSWEFIWRGYMLFGLESKFGYYAIFIQMIPFVILHNGKPALETFSAIIGGVLLGILALRTRSFLYGVLIHFCLIFNMDLLSTLRYKSNEFGVGINSFIKIFFN